MKSAKAIVTKVPALNLQRVPRSTKNVTFFYAVGRGKETGIYDSWDACKIQVSGFPNAKYKKFSSNQDAEKFVEFWKNYSPENKEMFESKNKKTEESAFVIDKDNYVEVYTDGSACFIGSPNASAGLGVWFGENHPLNMSKPVEGVQTCNAAELQAALRAIELAQKAGIKKLKIFTDSSYLISCATKWVYSWQKNGWICCNKQPVKHQITLKNLCNEMEKLQVRWEKVISHSGVVGNESAHRLAQAGVVRDQDPKSCDEKNKSEQINKN